MGRKSNEKLNAMDGNTTYIRIGKKVALILGVLFFLLYAFIVRGEVGGSTFATSSGQGGLELLIDSRTIYNNVLQPKLTWTLKHLVPGVDKFFNFADVKPGDTGTTTISIHVKQNPAWICLDFTNLVDKDNSNTEPEAKVDVNGPLGGELSSALEFFAWVDDGDNKFEVGERPLFGTSTQAGTTILRNTSYALADYTHGSPIPVNSTKYIGITWCAGDLKVSTSTAKITCNGEVMGNGTQTDSMSLDVTLRAVQASDQPKFSCVVEKKPTCKVKGNNGHGNDEDHNDDSNPGHSNDEDDDTDDDGLPPGFAKKTQTNGSYVSGNNHTDEDDDEDCDDEDDDEDDKDKKDDKKDGKNTNEHTTEWQKVEKKGKAEQVVSYWKDVFKKFRV